METTSLMCTLKFQVNRTFNTVVQCHVKHMCNNATNWRVHCTGRGVCTRIILCGDIIFIAGGVL